MLLLTVLVLVIVVPAVAVITALALAAETGHDTDNPYECDCCEATFPTVARFAAHVCDRETVA